MKIPKWLVRASLSLLPLFVYVEYAYAADESIQSRLDAQSQQISQLQKRLDELSADKGTSFRVGNPVELNIYGHINQAVVYADDQYDPEWFFTTNSVSNSRLNIDGRLQPNKQYTVGSHVELGFNVNASNAVSQVTPSPSANIDLRQIDMFVQSQRWGKLYLGKGHAATDGMMDTDYSGTTVVAGSDVMVIGGALYFRNSTTGELTGNPQVSNVFNNFDGLGRSNRIRYDSPAYKSMNFAVAHNEGEQSDVIVHYEHKFSDLALGWTAGYTSPQASGNTHGNVLGGSVGLKWANGWSLVGAGALLKAEDDGRKNPSFDYMKLGYQTRLNDLGDTSFSVDYGIYENINQSDDKAKTLGLAIAQQLKGWRTVAYGEYRHFSLDRPGSGFDGMHVFVAGLKFDF